MKCVIRVIRVSEITVCDEVYVIKSVLLEVCERVLMTGQCD